MSEEIKENIKAYYIGSDIDKVLDYIQQKENIIKEVRHYIKDTKQDGYKLVWIDKDNNYFESGIEEILDKEVN